MTPQDEIERAVQAQKLLDDPLLNEALKAIKASIFEEWGRCKAGDAKGKEYLWQLLKTCGMFESTLFGYVQTGKIARENLRVSPTAGKLTQLLRRYG